MRTPQMFGAVVLCAAALSASDLLAGKTSLTGLTVFDVVVDVSGKCASSLNQKAIQTDVELALRSAGLSVSKAVDLTTDGAILGASLSCVPVTTGDTIRGWAVIVGFQAYTSVKPQRTDKPARTVEAIPAIIWFSQYLMITNSNDLQADTRSAMKDKVDEFLNDYLAQNPRPR